MQDVPGIGAEPGEQDQRRAGPVEDQSGVELGEVAGHGAIMPQVALDFSGQSRDHGSMAAPIAPAVLAELLGSGWRRHRETAEALADALRALAVDGRLAARTRVPSERALAPALGVGRGTVTRAYDRLREDGYLVSARGAGSWLTLPDGAPAGQPLLPPLSRRRARARSISRSPPRPARSRCWARPPRPPPPASPATRTATATPGAGLPELRAAVADRFTERGVPTTRRADPDHRGRAARPAPRARAARLAGRPRARRRARLPAHALRAAPRAAARRAGAARARRLGRARRGRRRSPPRSRASP